MLISANVVEVYDCNYRVANLLLAHGWTLIHAYTKIHSAVGETADAVSRYSLYRLKGNEYTSEMAEQEVANGPCAF